MWDTMTDDFKTFPSLKICGLISHLSDSTRFLKRVLAPVLGTFQSNMSDKSGLACVKGRVWRRTPESPMRKEKS